MKIFRFVKQSNLKDCASSCIYNLIRYYKGNVNYNNITKKLNITEKGSSIYNVVKTLKYYKFTSDAYKCNYDNLITINHPFIAYLKIEEYYHYVIIKKIKNNKVYIFDPIRGNLIYTKNQFILEWQNIIIDVISNNAIVKEKNSYKRYLYTLIGDNKLLLSVIFIFAIFFTISNLTSTYLLKYIIDELDFKKVIFLIIIFESIKRIFSYIYGRLMIKANIKLNNKIRTNMYNKIFNLPNTKEVKTINFIYRIDDLSCISDFIFTFPELLIDILYILMIFIYFIYVGYLYPYIILLFIIFILIYYISIRKRIINLFDKERNNYSKLTSSLIEKINVLPIINKLNVNKQTINTEINNYNNYLFHHKKLNNNMLNYNFILNILFLFLYIVLLIISFWYNSLDLISLGDFYINYSLIIMLTASIDNILNYDRLFLSSKNAFKRIVDLYDYDFNEEGNHNKRILFNKSTFIYDKYNSFKDKLINCNNSIFIYKDENILNESIKDNISFQRNTSIEEINKVKRICLIDETSNKEKIILARSLLSNKNLILVNLFSDINPKEERIILKNILTEYNKKIILVSNRKDNSDLFKNLARIKGGKCEKVRYL